MVNSGTGTEIRTGILRGAGHAVCLNLGGDEKGVFICNKPLTYILKCLSVILDVLVHLGCTIKHHRQMAYKEQKNIVHSSGGWSKIRVPAWLVCSL